MTTVENMKIKTICMKHTYMYGIEALSPSLSSLFPSLPLSLSLWADKQCYFCAYQSVLGSVCLCRFSGKHLKNISLRRPYQKKVISTKFDNRNSIQFVFFFALVLVLSGVSDEIKIFHHYHRLKIDESSLFVICDA